MIIPATELNGNSINRARIVNMFCEKMMQKIKLANSGGRNKCLFDATIWYNPKTGELSVEYRESWKYDNADPHRYLFDDYSDEIEKAFVAAGYTIKPTGYIGGVWQRSKDIYW